MNESNSIVDQLENRVKRVINRFEQLSGENLDLQIRIEELESELLSIKQKSAALENRLSILTISNSISSKNINNKSESTEVKRKINTYIREIDKCIALLNQ